MVMDGPRKVLIADDDLYILRLLECKFSRCNFRVIKVQDGRSALELAKIEKPHIVIADYNMPGLNGIELALKMSEIDSLKDIPVILLTAHGFSIDQKTLIGTNVVGVETKPFSPSELVKAVCVIIDCAFIGDRCC